MSLKLFFSLKLTNVQRVPLNCFRNLLRQNVFQFRMLRLCLCTCYNFTLAKKGKYFVPDS